MSDHTTARTGAAVAASFVGLREEAVRLVGSSPVGLEDAALAAALFGTEDGSRWASLLGTVLNDDDRLQRVAGRWRLADPAAAPGACTIPELSTAKSHLFAGPDADPVVTLALATTGADPRRHRIARIAVVRRERGEVSTQLDAVVSTGGRLSRRLRDAARVGEDDLEEASPFADVVPALRELVDGRVVYTYGATRTRAFLEMELRRAGLPRLDADLRELDTLLGSLLPEARKPGLAAAADELGIPRGGRSSPLAEALLAARVVERLRERQAASPARGAVVPAIASEASETLPFTRGWLEGVPDAPGVYVLTDASGRALYVGKAVDLRRRLSAYVGQQLSLHRQLESLGVRAASVAVTCTLSDLESTLLEARLIRERQPLFNVARQTRPPLTVIRAALDERSPGVRLVSAAAPDGARYFGPFESTSAARQALSIARTAYPDACLRRRGDVAVQRQAVLNVCRLLAGQKEPAVVRLRAAMRDAAANGDSRQVERLRAALTAVQCLELRPSVLAGLAPGWQLLILEHVVPGLTRTHLLQDGQRLRSVSWQMTALPTDGARLRQLARAMLEEPPDEDDEGACADDPDEPAIVLRWLTQARARIEIERVPPDPGSDKA